MKLYHLSAKKLADGYRMIPRIPESEFEEQTTPRICFAPTIQGCLIGACEDKDLTGKYFYVYYIETDDYYQPTKEEVQDIEATGEVWILYPVIPTFKGVIYVSEKSSSKVLHFADNDFEVPIWDYKFIDNPDMLYLDEKIVKKGSQWQVQSEKGRNMGTYDTKAEAKKRLQQVHYFKYKNEGINITGRAILKDWKAYIKHILSLNETDFIAKLDIAPSKFIEHSPFFITTNGNIYNASDIDKSIDVAHISLFINDFSKKYGIDKSILFSKMTDLQSDKFFDAGIEVLDYVIDNFNWIKFNAGTKLDNFNPYIIIPTSISSTQHTVLKDCLYHLWEINEKKVIVYSSIGGNQAEYNLATEDPEYIMDRIDTFYRTGILLESKNKNMSKIVIKEEADADNTNKNKELTEDTRTALIAKSRNAGDYKDKSKGKNRFERKKYSRVASTVKEYNQIDMNDFFKKDILTVKVPVTGETDSYIVSIKLEGVVAEIQKEIKNNKNQLEFKTIIQSLTKIFNTGNVYVNCTCKDFRYNFSHWSIVNNYSTEDTAHDPGPGKNIRNPKDDKGRGCKHVLLVLANGDWMMKVASCIKNYIFYAEEHMTPAFDKLIFPKLYNTTVDNAIETDLVSEDVNLETEKHIIEKINDWAKNRGKYRLGSNKNPVTGTGGRQKK